VRTATSSWPHQETDPQRVAILAAADRLLAGTPTRSTGNLSVVQLAAEADVKYWVVAQKHTDLRDHFQQLTVQARQIAATVRDNQDGFDRLRSEHAELKAHCAGLEQLIQTYARVINELTLENEALREQTTNPQTAITPLRPPHRRL
jgi:FtsZ-binding cell division protein ZapB